MQTTKNIIAGTLMTGAVIAATGLSAGAQGTDAIRPFKVHIPEEKLVDLKRRILATQWPDPEVVRDETQGVQFATMQALAKYWATEYDWRKVEARLNALPLFIT